MPIVVIGAAEPTVIREDGELAMEISSEGLKMIDPEEPAAGCPVVKPEPTRKRRA